jgi:dihydrodipicolinate synthase/N-acetylneuraminate lyase
MEPKTATPSRHTRREILATLGAAALAGTCKLAATGRQKEMRGVFPIMATPYTHSNAVDYDDLAREVEFLDRCGVPGMAWPQLFGETFKLTQQERKRGMEEIMKAAKGRRPAIVLGVDGPNLAAAMDYLRHAESLNPDALIALPPWEAKSSDELLPYYRALAGATKRPLFIQNAEIVKGVKLEIPALIELAREFPHSGYYKEEVQPTLPRMLELSRQRPPVQRVFAGEGGKNLFYVMRLGLDGCMAGNAYADAFVQVWDLFQSGSARQAQEIYARILLILGCESYLPGTRQYILKKRGVFKTTISRRESFSLSGEAIREIDFHFEALKPHLKA